MENLTHGSLFSGIGGFELGAQLAGIKTLYNVEIDSAKRKILLKNFPLVKQHDNIIGLEPEYSDIISGGFPCQDISIANQNDAKGIKGKRSGLWAEMFRIIWNTRPKYAIIENSPMLTVRGFERVLLDLWEIGYDAEWQCLSAETFGYPHKRERLYCITYPNGERGNEKEVQTSIFNQTISKTSGREFSRTISGALRDKNNSEILRNDDGFPFVVDRIHGCGNAVIPDIAKYLFECIKNHNKQRNG